MNIFFILRDMGEAVGGQQNRAWAVVTFIRIEDVLL